MLELRILLAFIPIAFLNEACYYFYRLREKDKGISAKHYFHMTSTCRVGVALFKLQCLFLGGGAGEVTPAFPVFD